MARTWQISLSERIDPALPGPLYIVPPDYDETKSAH